MPTVKEMFSALESTQRDALMLAFNEQRDHIVILEDGTFIGCNLENIEDLQVDQQSDNGWISGRLKDA